MVKFNTSGNKRLKVTVTNASGVSSTSKERTINISPAKVDSLYYTNPMLNILSVFDLDTDGSDEFITSDGKKLMEQDKAGEVTMIRKMYNSSLPVYDWNSSRSYFKPVDVNRDGLIDILNYTSPDWNRYRVWTNNGNKDLSIGDEFSLARSDQYGTIFYEDFDNDGSLEGILSYCSEYYKLSDDCQSYQSFTMTDIPQPARLKSVYDFNGDGLLDLYVMIRTNPNRYTPDTPVIYYNNGDMTFRKGEQMPVLSEEVTPSLIGDFDSDGKVDLAYNGAGYAFGVSSYKESFEIQYGNGKIVNAICPDGRAFSVFVGAFDFDNNGFTDFIVRLSDNSHIIVYIMPDYSYSYSDIYSANIGDVYNAVFNRNNGTTYIHNLKNINSRNEAPGTPTGLRHTVNSKFVNIAWSSASDKETPSNGLKYNISIKHKNATGNGAYLISPMNQDKDGITVPHNHRLLVQPQISIPVKSIPAGEYEVRVQAVDNHNVSGAFSQVYLMNIPEIAEIDAPNSAIVDTPVNVSLIGNSSSASIDFGNDSEFKQSGNKYEVIWHSEGMRTITLGGRIVATLMVYKSPEAEFTIPSEILEGSTINVICPTAKSGLWYIIDNGIVSFLNDSPRISNISISDNHLTFTVKGESDFIIRHTVTENYGSNAVEHNCHVNSLNAKPNIDYVSVDSSGEHNEIHWNIGVLPQLTEAVNIYRETSHINEYELIGSVSSNDGKFVDMASNPEIKSERYAIAVKLPYGESAKSTLHQPMHLQLNLGIGNSVNLRWSKYEGRTVRSYQIYAGDNEESMQLLESVSGNISSYSDKTPKNFYAVTVLFENSPAKSLQKVINTVTEDHPISNVASSSDISSALLAQSLELYTQDGMGTVNLDETKNIKVSASLNPAGVSITQLDWSIEEGQNIASVNDNGVVTVSAPGEFCVAARTRDGSDLKSSITITAFGSEIKVEKIIITPESISGYVDDTYKIEAKIYPENATDKQIVWSCENPDIAMIIGNSQVKLLKVGTTTISATATDGSGVTALCLITVIDNDGIDSVLSDADSDVKIYTTTGFLVFEGKYSDAKLNAGIYIIVTKGNIYKMIIK